MNSQTITNIARHFLFRTIPVIGGLMLTVSAHAMPVPETVKSKTQGYANILLALSEQISAADYDIDARAEKLDYDVQQALEFVNNDIAYTPYIGVMRGPEGTISTKSGSSWDQAILLASLINSMGGEAILGIGKLNNNDASFLLKSAVTNKLIVPDALSGIDFKTALNLPFSYSSFFNANSAKGLTFENYQTNSQKISNSLFEKSKKAGVFNFDDINNRSAAKIYIQKIANNYVWVKYRDTPQQSWKDVHPAFAGSRIPDVKADQYIASSAPDKQLHKIGIMLEIEKWSNGKYSVHPIMREFVRPAANLAKQQIRIGITPNVADISTRPTYYLPTINGALPEAGMAFNLQGTVYAAEDAAAGPAIFDTVAKGFGSALNEMSKDDEAVGAPRLTGAFLTISQISPSGETTKETRRLFDLREKQGIVLPGEVLLNSILEVDIGHENGARDMKSALVGSALNIRQLPYHMGLVEKKMTPAQYVSSPAFSELPTHPWIAALAFNPLLSPKAVNGLVFRTSPLVMLRRIISSETAPIGLIIDVQHNQTAGFRLNDQGDIIAAPDLAFEHGVRETLMEGELIGLSDIPAWTRQQQGEFINKSSQLEKQPFWQSISALTQERMLNDLSITGALFIPKTSLEKDHMRWWRINPETANVLGMSRYGGSQLSEEVIFLESVASGITLVGFTMGMASGAQACRTASSSPLMRACCITGVSIANGALMLGGSALSGAANARWGSLVGFTSSVSIDVVSAAADPIGNTINDGSKQMCGYVEPNN
jgi:hypothetical protein